MPITWGPDTAWPIMDAEVADLFSEYRGWYVGEPTDLARFYAGSVATGLDVRPSQRAGGLQGWFARLFWGQPNVGTLGDLERIHIPAPANVSALVSDTLYSEPPTVRIDVEGDDGVKATDRMQEILTDGGVYSVLAESAELASAYGSAYRRITVDKDISDYPIVEALPPHCAIPEWRSGRLAAVTFWRVLPDPRNGVLRLLERHEPGMIQHQLRLGSDTKLGPVVPLGGHQETQRIAALASDDGIIATGIPMLDVVHQPNIRPNPVMPHEYYGRSDYWGAVSSFQSLDEAWSLWMDALRRAQPLVIVPQEYTKGLGPGKGATFDPAQRVFVAIKSLDPAKTLQIEQVNFQIDVDRYQRTAAGIWRNITRNSGLSADAFGEESSGAQATATEIGQRGARTVATRARRVGYAMPADRRTAAILAAYDAKYYAGEGSIAEARVTVTFPDGVTPDPKKDAEIVGLLDAAAAISLQVKVKMAHPDWDDTAIAEEVSRIEKEQDKKAESLKVTDPGTFGQDAPDGPPIPDDDTAPEQPAPAV